MPALSDRQTSGLASSVVLVLWLLCVPWRAAAQDIEILPPAWDFGDVVLGSTETVTFTLTDTELTPLTIYEVRLCELGANPCFGGDEFGAFEIVEPAPPPPVTLDFQESLLLAVTFSPTLQGLQDAALHVVSDALPPDHDILLPLRGNGVAAPSVPEPGTLALVCVALAGLIGHGLARGRPRRQAPVGPDR